MQRTQAMTSVQPDWDTFHKMGTSQKIPYFSKDNRLYDCLFAQQLNRELLEHLFKTADLLRSVTRKKDGADPEPQPAPRNAPAPHGGNEIQEPDGEDSVPF